MSNDRTNPKDLRAFTQLDFSKAEFATWVAEDKSVEVTDEQWEKIVEVLDSRLGSFVDELVYELVVDFRDGFLDDKKL
jgi:hypothetical protein